MSDPRCRVWPRPRTFRGYSETVCLKRVRQGTLGFRVATDLVAPGLDIPERSHVIQYEPPEDPEGYIHRAGRTGRAGALAPGRSRRRRKPGRR